MASRHKRVSTPFEDGLIQLRATETGPQWIWVETCHIVDCECRAAVVVASRAGKDELLASAAAVRKHLDSGAEVAGIADAIGADCVAIDLDIDSGQMQSIGETELDAVVEKEPWLRSVLERIDGPVLDDIGRMSYRGKGLPDPEEKAVNPRDIRDWKPGEEVAWEEAYWGLRRDSYAVGEQFYELFDYYCVTPDCDCGKVTLSVGRDDEKQDVAVGTVKLEKGAEPIFDPHDGTREELESVWAAYQKRYPNYPERHAAREKRMKEFGKALLAYYEEKSKPKVGQNDPCPCGSGKKYKKCCWKKQLGA